MHQKIQELTDRIYQEGVQKGEQKAEEIVRAAQARAEKTIAEAREEAKKIIDDATKQTQEQKRNVASEIRLSAAQATSAVKQRILDVITAKAIDERVSASLSDPQTIKDLIQTVISSWNPSSNETSSLEMLLPEEKRNELEKAFKNAANEIMAKGVEIRFSKGIKGGFQISRKEGGFKISLTDEDFKEFFKEYLRPKTKAFLFGE